MTVDTVSRTTGAALALSALAPDQRAARDAQAVANLKARGAEDLLEMLGLADVARPTSGPRSVACPTCDAAAGEACTKQYQEGTLARFHRSRYRLVGAERS